VGASADREHGGVVALDAVAPIRLAAVAVAISALAAAVPAAAADPR
jgi:hypothetical protein